LSRGGVANSDQDSSKFHSPTLLRIKTLELKSLVRELSAILVHRKSEELIITKV